MQAAIPAQQAGTVPSAAGWPQVGILTVAAKALVSFSAALVTFPKSQREATGGRGLKESSSRWMYYNSNSLSASPVTLDKQRYESQFSVTASKAHQKTIKKI